jgi:hypothetical protein
MGKRTIVRLGGSFEVGVAGMRDGSDLGDRRWYIRNVD